MAEMLGADGGGGNEPNDSMTNSEDGYSRFAKEMISPASSIQWTKLIIAIGCIFITVIVTANSFRGPARFPKHHDGERDPQAIADWVLPQLSAKHKLSKNPRLPLGVPRRVPGVSAEIGAFAPSLTSDLKTIVFAAHNNLSKSYDLYLANATQPAGTYLQPSLISSCNTVGLETNPTISPDGLELAFARFESGRRGARIFLARRPTTSATFELTGPLTIPGPSESEISMDLPNFLGADSLVFKLVTFGEAESHQYMVCSRSDHNGEFRPPTPFPIQNSWPINIPSSDGLRVFVVMPDGIHVSSRTKLDGSFGLAGLIQPLSSSKLGSLDGSVWMSPEEDILFYCTFNPDKGPGADRSLRMIRFR